MAAFGLSDLDRQAHQQMVLDRVTDEAVALSFALDAATAALLRGHVSPEHQASGLARWLDNLEQIPLERLSRENADRIRFLKTHLDALVGTLTAQLSRLH